jgi:TfoX/Sxy family transcriptional regulator of competence genes
MAYDETIAARIREFLAEVDNVEEKNMFGGVCFMVNDKMCMGVVKDDMMCRIDPEKEPEALDQPGCRPMDFTGRPMKGYVYVSREGMRTKKNMQYWIDLCLAFNKKAKSSRKKRKK